MACITGVTLAIGPQPESVSPVMAAIRRLYRLLLLVGLLLWGVLATVAMLPQVKQGIPNQRVQRIRQRWLARVIRVLGIEPVVHGEPMQQPGLWVANHISWADIPLIGSLAPVGFLSKAEIRNWPIIGWLAEHTGTLFIRRGDRKSSLVVTRLLYTHIKQGHSILIFPEGTTSPGDGVRRFHARLFAPAIDAHLFIQPVAIFYRHENGARHQYIPFVDHQPFFANLWRLLGDRRVRAEVYFLPPIQGDRFSDRRSLAEQVHDLIETKIHAAQA